MEVSNWLNLNIKKFDSKNDVYIDLHPISILERKIGTPEQFADLLSLLLVYADLDSFKINFRFNKQSVVFFSIDRTNKKNWIFVDPYVGLYSNNINIEEFTSKSIKLKIFSLSDKYEITKENFKPSKFIEFFPSYEKMHSFYNDEIKQTPLLLFSKNYFALKAKGNKSYLQKPIDRLFYEFLNFFSF